MKKGWKWFAALAAVIAILYAYQMRQEGRVVKVERRIYVDTIRYYMPLAKNSTITRYVIAKLPTAQPQHESPAESLKTAADTIYLPAAPADSAEVVLPVEQKHYRGNEYEAWVSGYHPQLDSISIYNRMTETTITKIGRKNRWGIGINAGIGITPRGAAPYIGIGVSYSFFSF